MRRIEFLISARPALGSCAIAPQATAQAPTTASSAPAVRLKVIRMVCQPLPAVFEVHSRSVDAGCSRLHSVLDDPDAIAALRWTLLGLHVGDAAKREGNFASRIGLGQALCLSGSEFQRGGVALGELLAVLGLDQLTDGENAHVVK